MFHCKLVNPGLMSLFAYLQPVSLIGRTQHATRLHKGSSIAHPRIIQ